MKIEEIVKALNNLAPNAKWSLLGNNYEDLIWLSEGNPPNLSDVQQEIIAIPIKEAQAKADAHAKKTLLLAKLEITHEEAKLLLS